MSFARDYVLSKFFGEGSGGNEDDLFLAINNGTITDFVATENMYKLRPYMFAGNTTLKSVDLSKLNAPQRPDISFPYPDLANLLGKHCFEGCSSLENIILPEVLDTSDAARGRWLGEGAFYKCTGLKEFVTDKAGLLGNASVELFRYCTGLKKVIMPNVTSEVQNRVFGDCTSLELVDFGGGYIGNYWFYNCRSLKVLVIRSTTVTNLLSAEPFVNTPFASGGAGGTVYVPQALIEEYKQATNWSALYSAGTCNFMAIEGSEYE